MLWNDVWFRMKTSDEIARSAARASSRTRNSSSNTCARPIGDEYNVPTLAVLRSPPKSTRTSFPRNCCIKPTHASAQVILRVDG